MTDDYSIPTPLENQDLHLDHASIPYGICQCGCGKPTKPYARNYTEKGYIKGALARFLEGHRRGRSRPALERFWEKVDKTPGYGPWGDCWEWTASCRPIYGVFHYEGSDQSAHRVSWQLAYGVIPDNLWVLHRCDNPLCIRPNHLFLGTHADNMQDRQNKGRTISPCAIRNSQKTHCPKGHPYSDENTFLYRKNRRCRLCRRQGSRKQ
jgi:hypothetical protein